jgi:hypothetical protein
MRRDFSCRTAIPIAVGALPRIARRQSGSFGISICIIARRIVPKSLGEKAYGRRDRHQLMGEDDGDGQGVASAIDAGMCNSPVNRLDTISEFFREKRTVTASKDSILGAPAKTSQRLGMRARSPNPYFKDSMLSFLWSAGGKRRSVFGSTLTYH